MSRAAKVVVQNEFLAVIDDVLGTEQRDGLWNYFQLQPFQRIDALGMQGQWSLEDSGVLRGPTVGWGRAWDAEYPTGTPIDHVIKAVVERETEVASVVGAQGVVWDTFSAFPTIHVAGQGRLWHRDTDEEGNPVAGSPHVVTVRTPEQRLVWYRSLPARTKAAWPIGST